MKLYFVKLVRGFWYWCYTVNFPAQFLDCSPSRRSRLVLTYYNMCGSLLLN